MSNRKPTKKDKIFDYIQYHGSARYMDIVEFAYKVGERPDIKFDRFSARGYYSAFFRTSGGRWSAPITSNFKPNSRTPRYMVKNTDGSYSVKCVKGRENEVPDNTYDPSNPWGSRGNLFFDGPETFGTMEVNVTEPMFINAMNNLTDEMIATPSVLQGTTLEFLTAKQARKITDENSFDAELLKKIFTSVKQASKLGEDHLTIYGPINRATEKKLESLGYTVVNRIPVNGESYINLSW